ncbi:MAG TPA: SCP2 sterol-binding domain-containing protein [Woeseiaceae bacterium]|nr:SCP2 sterol-binding domain-containing protein [Woeseiaceae bacterium]
MTQGGKPHRASMVDAPVPSTFAALRPFLKSGDTDLTKSVEKLSTELADFDSRVNLNVKVLEGSNTHAWELACGPSGSATRRRAGRSRKPDVRLVVRHDAWLQIAQGKLNPFDAFLSGKLLVGGDIGIAKRLVEHLSDPNVPYVSPC